MRKKGTKISGGSLQLRMTVFVTVAVLLGSSVVLSIIAGLSNKASEKLLEERLADDLTAVTRIMEQRLKRVEDSMGTLASIAPLFLSSQDDMDTLLLRSIGVMDDVWALSLVFDKGFFPSVDGYYERGVFYEGDDDLRLDSYVNGVELESDPDWNNCFVQGNLRWGEAPREVVRGHRFVGYYVPLTDRDGHRFGMAYSAVLESYLTSFVAEYKVRKDIDISIYKPDGTMVVSPDEYILELSPEDKLVRECIIDHIGWKVVLSADRKVIDRSVRKAMLVMLLLIALMFIVIFLSISLTVRYVAKPFIQTQKRIEQEKAVMENEMALAAGAQHELVPHVFPPFPDRKGIDISACLHPARKVGGDLYDYFIIGDKLYFCIGDVSGKGVQASLFMAAVHYLFRSMKEGMPIADAAGYMNDSLCTDNEQCRFVTFWMGCLDLGSGALEYVNAGHDAPLLVRNGGVEVFPASEDMPLGVLESVEFVPGKSVLKPGDMLLLYTDGVTEAMDAEGREFGKARLNETLENAAATEASGVIESVLAGVRRHSCGTDQSDDITMLCLKFIEKEIKHQ